MPEHNQSIQVSHNGTTETLPVATHLASAIDSWGYGDKKIAAAINGDFIPRGQYSLTTLNQGDNIDIVRPVGGG
jgi:sulfur carrier protein